MIDRSYPWEYQETQNATGIRVQSQQLVSVNFTNPEKEKGCQRQSDKCVWFQFCTLKTSWTAMKGQIQCGFYSQKSDSNENDFSIPSLFKYKMKLLVFRGCVCEVCSMGCVLTVKMGSAHHTWKTTGECLTGRSALIAFTAHYITSWQCWSTWIELNCFTSCFGCLSVDAAI